MFTGVGESSLTRILIRRTDAIPDVDGCDGRGPIFIQKNG